MKVASKLDLRETGKDIYVRSKLQASCRQVNLAYSLGIITLLKFVPVCSMFEFRFKIKMASPMGFEPKDFASKKFRLTPTA